MAGQFEGLSDLEKRHCLNSAPPGISRSLFARHVGRKLSLFAGRDS
jgi:hypothetical protein